MTVTVSSDQPLVLVAGGVLRDTLDDICDALEQVNRIFNEHEKKIKPFEDMPKQEATKEILTALPPKKASALIAALTDINDLAQSISPEDTQKQFAIINENINNLQNIRDNLHKALDGVVP